MKTKYISKAFGKGGEELDELKVGDLYSPRFVVSNKELTRTRKYLYVSLTLTPKSQYEGTLN